MTGFRTLDLEFFGTDRLIASFLAPGERGFVLFETGPASSAEALERGVAEAGFELGDLQAVFVTTFTSTIPGAPGCSPNVPAARFLRTHPAPSTSSIPGASSCRRQSGFTEISWSPCGGLPSACPRTGSR